MTEPKRKLARMGIARKLLLSNLLFVFIIILMMTVLAYYQLKQQTQQSLDENLQLQIQLLQEDFSEQIKAMYLHIDRLSRQSLVANMLVDNVERKVYLDQFVKGVTDGIKDFKVNVALADFSGNAIYQKQEMIYPLDAEEVAFLVENNQDKMRVDVVDNQFVYTIFKPVIYANTQMPEGCLVYQFGLSGWLANTHVNELLNLSPIITRLTLVLADQALYSDGKLYDTQGLSVMVNLDTPLALSSPLKLGFMIDSARIDEPLKNLLTRTLLAGLMIFVIATILFSYLVRRQTFKLLRLRRQTDQLAENVNRELVFFSENSDEVDDLANAFNSLMERLRDAYDELNKTSRQRLRTSENRFQSIIQNIPDGIFVYDENGYLVDVNPVAVRQTGYNMVKLKSMKITQLAPHIDERSLKSTWALASMHPEKFPLTLEVDFCNSDGQAFPAEVRLTTITFLDDKRYFIAIVRDVSERKRYERELHDAKEKAEMGNRVKTQFLANMSHELRTPMNAILGMTDLVLHNELPEKQKKFIQKANMSARRLLKIVTDILDFSRIEAEKLPLENISFNIEELFLNLSGMVNLIAEEKQQHWSYQIDSAVPSILVGDPVRIGQVLSNLANNAVKFTPENGHIEAGVELLSRNEDLLKLHFWIRDNGIGIEEDKKALLFEAFSQGDMSSTRKFGGTGLGLAISRKLIELMEGEIWYESNPGEGTTFHFTIHLHDQA